MLSAAFDIIHNISHSGDSGNKNGNESNDTIFYSSCTSVNGSYEERELCEKAGTSVSNVAQACVCVTERRGGGGGERGRKRGRERPRDSLI